MVHPTWQRTRPDDPEDLHNGWSFETGAVASPNGSGSIFVTGCTGDPINNVKTIRDLYEMSHDTSKKYSVPVLWDKVTNTIVNNESSEVIYFYSSICISIDLLNILPILLDFTHVQYRV